VAAKGVTVLDDGTIADRRGSLNIDDEGNPTQRNVLIEDGILQGYMQDSMNARLMGVKPTGNGRRESYAHVPMPRMTNTYMLSGDRTKEEIVASIKRGLYATNFGGGQVDITSGKFVFSASKAVLGRERPHPVPVKGATIIGNGPDALTRVKMIGNDLQLDTGVGDLRQGGPERAGRRRPADAAHRRADRSAAPLDAGRPRRATFTTYVPRPPLLLCVLFGSRTAPARRGQRLSSERSAAESPNRRASPGGFF
jgi:hypothetical protein